ncbi:protein LIAT1 isoform X2 [Amphiprion ocellaris]|uniref:protein LIAT1 isoform X2 n=1 Tax=Amphiprion ocellaris TaxID=80972 RepID=UPI002410ECA5|nr:protein LIAT1 isoform X2 [Amphiprion ocellaris]XP_035812477.2 protein LIAT1 isoform X2 [Amphiprion ocellaris]
MFAAQPHLLTVCQHIIMPEDKNCKLLQPARICEQKQKKKKKRKKTSVSTAEPENTEKPQPGSLPPETSPVSLLPPQSPAQPQGQLPKLRASSKKSRERLGSSDRRSKKHLKDSPESGSGAPVQGYVTELSVQARESLRWEGALQDPQAEAKRLEQYRTNRRQRYIAHREALLKETQDALRQTFPKKSNEESLNVNNRRLHHCCI